MKDVVIVSACRTAIGKFMGSLKDVTARDLAITAGREAIKRAGIPAEIIDEIVMGECISGMQGSLPARQVGMRVGLPHRSAAVSVNQNCASGADLPWHLCGQEMYRRGLNLWVRFKIQTSQFTIYNNECKQKD